jgi:hypothetical protein
VSYEELNDAERLSQAPTFASSARGRYGSVAAALTSRSQSFETALLTQEDNLAGLAGLNRELITKGETIDSSHGWCWTCTAPRFQFKASRRGGHRRT